MPHQTGALQDAQVLAHRRSSDGELVGELADGTRPAGEAGDDLAADWLAEGVEDGSGVVVRSC
jgi:hypothetical protein